MAYNVEQLINLRNQIGSQPIMPDASDRYAAMMGLTQQGGLPSMLNTGGQPDTAAQVQNLASKGRYGDTMLMHVNPKEVAGLGGLTINPETGLPEAFWMALPFLAKAMIIGAGIGAGRKALGGSGSWLQNILGGAAIGTLGGSLLGPGGMLAAGAPTVAAGGATTATGSAAASGVPLAYIGATQAAGGAGGVGLTSSVPAGFLGATQAAGGAGGVGLANAPLASTASPTWAKNIFGSKLWQGIEAHPYRTASTLGMASMAIPPEYEYPTTTEQGTSPTVPFPEVDVAERELRREPVTEEEAVARASGEIPSFNFYTTKEGGLLSLQGGGMASSTSIGQLPYTPGGQGRLNEPPPPGYTYVPGQTALHQPVLKKTSDVGGVYTGGGGASNPVLLKGAQMGELGKLIQPLDDRSGPAADVTLPFEFPEVTPFQPFTSPSSFNFEDRLARITGQDQTPQVPVVLPEQVFAPVPTDTTVPTDTSALGDLFARFQQTAQVDPIAGLVAPAVGVKKGGLPELAHGGIFEGHVQGRGDGMADQVAFNVVPQTPADAPKTPDMALLSSDEYVVPADVVSMLGNGSSNAGAKALDKFNTLMRHKAYGTNKQQREINAGRELSSLV